MKRLLLTSSSDFFYEHILEYVDKPLDQVKIAWITTAKKGSDSQDYMEKHYQQMVEMPFDVTEIDIEGKDADELRKLLADKDIIYFHGGNTFYLMRAIKETGFQKVLEEQMEKGVLYVGTSAGSYVACPTLEMCEWKSDSKYHPFDGQDLTGMNLVPFLVSVHFEEQYRDDIKKGKAQTDLEVYVLTDEQALYVENNQVTELNM